MRKSFRPLRRLFHPLECQQLGVELVKQWVFLPFLASPDFLSLFLGSSMHPAMYACTWVNKSFCWPHSLVVYLFGQQTLLPYEYVSICEILSAVFVRTAIDEA